MHDGATPPCGTAGSVRFCHSGSTPGEPPAIGSTVDASGDLGASPLGRARPRPFPLPAAAPKGAGTASPGGSGVTMRRRALGPCASAPLMGLNPVSAAASGGLPGSRSSGFCRVASGTASSGRGCPCGATRISRPGPRSRLHWRSDFALESRICALRLQSRRRKVEVARRLRATPLSSVSRSFDLCAAREGLAQFPLARQRATHFAVSFSCTAFCWSRAFKPGKSTRSIA